MSDRQQAAMLQADDSYAGSATFTRLQNKVEEIFGKKYFLPAHQGRACENILSRAFVKPGTYVLMNYHFTTTKSHIEANGGEVVELITEAGLAIDSDHPFKGNMDTAALDALIAEKGAEKIAFVRMEAGTNLIGNSDGGRAVTATSSAGKEFNVTRERIRQIEAKALRKLKHPSRSNKLRDFLE